MATRAVYTYKDDREEFHVYKHYDNNPDLAITYIKNAVNRSWNLPRFEASDAAAAFIAANKEEGGDVYLTTNWKHHSDLDYRYEIERKEHRLHVSIFQVVWPQKSRDDVQYKLIASGTIKELQDISKIN